MIRDGRIYTTLQRVFAAFGEQEPNDLAAFDRDDRWYRYVVTATIGGKRISGVFYMEGMQRPQKTDTRSWYINAGRYEDSMLLLDYIEQELNKVEIPTPKIARTVDEIYHETSEAEFEARMRAYEWHCNTDDEYRELQRQRVVGYGLGW